MGKTFAVVGEGLAHHSDDEVDYQDGGQHDPRNV
jgi:hypothetical protein